MNYSTIIDGTIFEIQSWDDYWLVFDELCARLEANNKDQVTIELRDAQVFVNGFTDGWYDFFDSFEVAVSRWRNMFDAQEIQLSDFLLSTLRKSLRLNGT